MGECRPKRDTVYLAHIPSGSTWHEHLCTRAVVATPFFLTWHLVGQACGTARCLPICSNHLPRLHFFYYRQSMLLLGEIKMVDMVGTLTARHLNPQHAYLTVLKRTKEETISCCCLVHGYVCVERTTRKIGIKGEDSETWVRNQGNHYGQSIGQERRSEGENLPRALHSLALRLLQFQVQNQWGKVP